MSKTKTLKCTVCGVEFEGSKFASPKTAKCNNCKGQKKKSRAAQAASETAGISKNAAVPDAPKIRMEPSGGFTNGFVKLPVASPDEIAGRMVKAANSAEREPNPTGKRTLYAIEDRLEQSLANYASWNKLEDGVRIAIRKNKQSDWEMHKWVYFVDGAWTLYDHPEGPNAKISEQATTLEPGPATTSTPESGSRIVVGTIEANEAPEIEADPLPADFNTLGGWELVGKMAPEELEYERLEREHLGNSIKDTVTHSENSMRANRAAKLDGAKPFVPKPYFLRQSMIYSYIQCPDKFYDEQENGYNEDTMFTKTGTAIHGIMEDYYNARRAGQPFDVNVAFDKWWAEHATPEWTWYAEWRKYVESYFERQEGKPEPKVIATELEFHTTINGVPVSGTIDRIDRIDDQTIEIRDYKTNTRPWTQAELEESIQFQMYALAVKTDEVRQLLRERGDSGEFNVVLCTYDMLRLGYEQHIFFSDEQLAMFADWMKVIWQKMLAGADRAPRLNQYCAFCQKRHRCPLYIEQLNAPVKSIITENTSLEEIDQERERLLLNKKLIEKRIDEIEEQLKAAIAQNGGPIQIGDSMLYTRSSPRYSYDAAKVIQMLTMHGMSGVIPDVVSVTKTKLERALKDNKPLFKAIEETKSTTYTAPTLEKKKVQKEKAADGKVQG